LQIAKPIEITERFNIQMDFFSYLLLIVFVILLPKFKKSLKNREQLLAI